MVLSSCKGKRRRGKHQSLREARKSSSLRPASQFAMACWAKFMVLAGLYLAKLEQSFWELQKETWGVGGGGHTGNFGDAPINHTVMNTSKGFA